MKTNWRRRLRHLIPGTLLVPFLLLSLIAAPVMPRFAADGSVTMVICTGDGALRVTIDPTTGNPTRKSGDGDQRGGCDWACATPAVMLTAAVTLPVPMGRQADNDPQPRPFHLTAASASGLPPSTGPPFAA